MLKYFKIKKSLNDFKKVCFASELHDIHFTTSGYVFSAIPAFRTLCAQCDLSEEIIFYNIDDPLDDIRCELHRELLTINKKLHRSEEEADLNQLIQEVANKKIGYFNKKILILILQNTEVLRNLGSRNNAIFSERMRHVIYKGIENRFKLPSP